LQREKFTRILGTISGSASTAGLPYILKRRISTRLQLPREGSIVAKCQRSEFDVPHHVSQSYLRDDSDKCTTLPSQGIWNPPCSFSLLSLACMPFLQGTIGVMMLAPHVCFPFWRVTLNPASFGPFYKFSMMERCGEPNR